MKIVLAILIFCLFAAMAKADIDQVLLSSREICLGDGINVSAHCVDAAGVQADIQGPGVLLPNLNFAPAGDGMYQLHLPGSYFDRKGDYSVYITCSGANSSNATASFSIFELSSGLALPASVFRDEIIELDFTPKRDGTPITTNISFSVFVNGQITQLTMPAIFDSNKGWVLKIASPASNGTYNITASAAYQGKIIRSVGQVVVKDLVEFAISPGSLSATSGNNLTFSVTALNYGSTIPVNEDNLMVYIDSEDAEILSITPSGSSYDIKITAPQLSPGTYKLFADLRYNGTIYTASATTDYVTVLSGKLMDKNGKPLAAQITFFKSGVQKLRINTMSDGTYSAQIVPDTYDIDLEFPEAKVHLTGAWVNSFTNPVSYQFDSNERAEGLATSGIYTIGTSWGFDQASVTLNYNPDTFSNPFDLNVFKCPNWKGDGTCAASWVKIIPTVNIGQHRVSFTTSSLSVFGVGLIDKILLSFTMDKEKYSLTDVISIRGTTSSNSGMVGNATVKLGVAEFREQIVQSNANGVFAADFVAPAVEGTYTMTATAAKYPFVQANTSRSFEVASMPGVSMMFPGTVQVAPGRNITEEIVVTNTGQTDIEKISLALDLESKYYEIGQYPDRLAAKQEITVPVTFFAGKNETETTMNAAIKFTSDKIEQKKIFGFTIKQEAETPQSTNPVTGFSIAMPDIDMNIVYIAIIAAGCFAAAFVLKRSRKKQEIYTPKFMQQPAMQAGSQAKILPAGQVKNPEPMPSTATGSPMTAAKSPAKNNYLNEVKSYLEKGKE
jgi:hypothetical protein